MNISIKSVRSLAKAYLACLVIFTVLLVAVWCVPKSLIKPQVIESCGVLAEEGDYPQTRVTASMRSDTIDSFTTALSLNIAVHGTGNPLKDAFAGSYYKNGEVFTANLAEGIDKPAGEAYTRYWHGYLVVLIPLLTVFSLVQIRSLFLVAMGLLSCAACALIGRKTSLLASLALALSLIMANVWVAAFSTSLAFSFFVALVAVILVALWADEAAPLGAERDWLTFFFVVGAVTSYLDFLNTPIVTLGLPLATYLAIRHESVASASLKEAAVLLAGTCVAWGLGYGLLWASKWVLSAIVLGTNALGDAVGTAGYRVGANGMGARIDAIKTNVNTMLDTWQRYLVAALGVVLLLVGIIFHKRPCLPLAIALLVVTLLPMLWYVALANHSTIHAFFVYRALSVSFYGAALMPSLLIDWKRLRRS